MTNEILLAIIILLLALSNVILYLRINNLFKMLKLLKKMVDTNFEFTTEIANKTVKQFVNIQNIIDNIIDDIIKTI